MDRCVVGVMTVGLVVVLVFVGRDDSSLIHLYVMAVGREVAKRLRVRGVLLLVVSQSRQAMFIVCTCNQELHTVLLCDWLGLYGSRSFPIPPSPKASCTSYQRASGACCCCFVHVQANPPSPSSWHHVSTSPMSCRRTSYMRCAGWGCARQGAGVIGQDRWSGRSQEAWRRDWLGQRTVGVKVCAGQAKHGVRPAYRHPRNCNRPCATSILMVCRNHRLNDFLRVMQAAGARRPLGICAALPACELTWPLPLLLPSLLLLLLPQLLRADNQSRLPQVPLWARQGVCCDAALVGDFRQEATVVRQGMEGDLIKVRGATHHAALGGGQQQVAAAAVLTLPTQSWVVS